MLVERVTEGQLARARRLSNARECVNAWIAEPGYAHRRLEQLRSR